MHRFQTPLRQGEDPTTRMPVFGFNIRDMFVFNPYESTCGRFEVDPVETYGISKDEADQLVALNKMLEDATQAAVTEGCFIAQKFLGIDDGGFAGAHFSGAENMRPVADTLIHYIAREIDRANDDSAG